MKFGFQLSISGGFSKVVGRAKRVGCETIQIFSCNPRQWKNEPLAENEVEVFKRDIKREKINPVFIHIPYLPNIASGEKNLYSKSIRGLCENLLRVETLGAPYLVLHIGRRMTSSEDEARERITQAINNAFDEVKNKVIILLENASGQGTEVGYTFSQIKAIINEIDDKNRVGLCLDTAHAFQAGYDLSRKKGLEKTIGELDRLIGLSKLRLLHLNDSKTPLGSRIDRHWHIGEGYIGLEGFRKIVNHRGLSHLPAIMETPCKNEADDLKNMSVVRKLTRPLLVN